MRNRTKAREYALQILYAVDIRKEPAELCADLFWKNTPEEKEDIKNFANLIVRGVFEKKDVIDSAISKYATNWQIERMATIDRNVLRLAAFELLFSEDVPPKVAINEAIEIAKKYGDKDSGKFVNGILDKISKTEKKGIS